MVWYGMVWYGMVWYGMVWYGTVWYAVLMSISVCLFAVIIAGCFTEFLDEVQMKVSIKYSKLTGFEAVPTLFLEFHGSNQSVEEHAKAAGFYFISLICH